MSELSLVAQEAGASGGSGAERIRKLIHAMATGDEGALAAFYDLTKRQTYGLSLRILKDAALAEEVTLDVYLQVWHEASSYRAERGSPLAWLITLTRSRAIDRRRKIKAEESLPDDGDEDDLIASEVMTDDWAIGADRAGHVRTALAQLSAEQRQALELAYFEGLSHGEIAERLAVPLGTIKTRIRAGMLRLHQLLAPWFSEETP